MKKRYLISLLIVVGMAIWVYSGYLLSSRADVSLQEEGEVLADDKLDLPLVRGDFSQASLHREQLMVRGRTEINRRVSVRAEVVGRVVGLPVDKGDRVVAGDLLCQLAVDTRDDSVDEARAALEQAELEYQGMQNLKEQGFQSQMILAEARTRLESARANLSRAELALKNTRIVAPFAGLLQEQPVELGDYLSVGGVCADLIDPDPLLLVGQVAERNVAYVRHGEPVQAELLSGQQVEGRISYVSQEGDQATRAYRIEAEVGNRDLQLRAGLTAEISLSLGSRLAHLISPALLVLDDQGRVGVRTVNGQERVEFHSVDIIDETLDGVWVVGLPDRVKIITVGQEEVFPGQEVKIDFTPLVSAAGD